ncbi:MAG: hypothetical protein ACOCV2_02975 [Persicimonas sp.]
MTFLHFRGLIVLSSLLLVVSACGSDDTQEENNSNWFEDDASGPDGGDDADNPRDADGGGHPDTPLPPPPDTGPDTGPDTSPRPDADPPPPDGGGDFPTAQLTDSPWYGLWRVASDPGVVGSLFEVDFSNDNTVTVGPHDEVTGEWEFAEGDRIRLYDLERDGEPNNPPRLVFESNLDGQHIESLEMYVDQGPDGEPYVFRLVQDSSRQVGVHNVGGNWQSLDEYEDDQGNPYRLAMRMHDGYIGYGIYNGAFVEYASGTPDFYTFEEDDLDVWVIDPPESGDPMGAFGGEIVDPDDDVVLYAPRQTNPGEEPAEYEAVEMERVDNFSVD